MESISIKHILITIITLLTSIGWLIALLVGIDLLIFIQWRTLFSIFLVGLVLTVIMILLPGLYKVVTPKNRVIRELLFPIIAFLGIISACLVLLFNVTSDLYEGTKHYEGSCGVSAAHSRKGGNRYYLILEGNNYRRVRISYGEYNTLRGEYENKDIKNRCTQDINLEYTEHIGWRINLE